MLYNATFLVHPVDNNNKNDTGFYLTIRFTSGFHFLFSNAAFNGNYVFKKNLLLSTVIRG